VALLGPGIWKEDEDPLDRSRGQRLNQHAGVIHEKPHIGEASLLHLGEQLDDAVLEHFAADQAAAWLSRGLCRQVLARPEAELEPYRLHRCGKKAARLEQTFSRHIEAELRQKRCEEFALRGPQLTAVATAVDDPRVRRIDGGRACVQNAARNSVTRSSRSQEKPPSASGVRPK